LGLNLLGWCFGGVSIKMPPEFIKKLIPSSIKRIVKKVKKLKIEKRYLIMKKPYPSYIPL